jgi:hypothetical protein
MSQRDDQDRRTMLTMMRIVGGTDREDAWAKVEKLAEQVSSVIDAQHKSDILTAFALVLADIFYGETRSRAAEAMCDLTMAVLSSFDENDDADEGEAVAPTNGPAA